MPARVVGRERFAPRRLPHQRDDLTRDRRGDVAALEVEGAVEETAAVEPQDQPPLFVATEGVLHFVPVVEQMRRGNGGPRFDAEPSQVREALLHLPHLVAELLGVIEVLKSAAAADRDVRAAGRHPESRGLEDPLGPSFGVLPLPPVDRGEDPIPGERVLDEHHHPLEAGERPAPEGQILDFQL